MLSLKQCARALLLIELLSGMALTLRYFFRPKVAVPSENSIHRRNP
jgi:hypothetical protein